LRKRDGELAIQKAGIKRGQKKKENVMESFEVVNELIDKNKREGPE